LLEEPKPLTPFGTGSPMTEAYTLTSSHFLASGPDGPRPKHLFGTGFERIAAYTPLWLRVLENRGLKLGCNCKNATAPLYASVPSQPRHIRRGKMGILH